MMKYIYPIIFSLLGSFFLSATNDARASQTANDIRNLLLVGEPVVIQMKQTVGTLIAGKNLFVRFDPTPSKRTTISSEIDLYRSRTSGNPTSVNSPVVWETPLVLAPNSPPPPASEVYLDPQPLHDGVTFKVWGASFYVMDTIHGVCFVKSNAVSEGCKANVLGAFGVDGKLTGQEIIEKSTSEAIVRLNSVDNSPATCDNSTYERVRATSEYIYQGAQLLHFSLSKQSHGELLAALSVAVEKVKTMHALGLQTDYPGACETANKELLTTRFVARGLYELYKFNPTSSLSVDVKQYLTTLWGTISSDTTYLSGRDTGITNNQAVYNSRATYYHIQLIMRKLGIAQFRPGFEGVSTSSLARILFAQVTSSAEMSCRDDTNATDANPYTLTKGSWPYASNVNITKDRCKANVSYTNFIISFLLDLEESISAAHTDIFVGDWAFIKQNNIGNIRAAVTAVAALQDRAVDHLYPFNFELSKSAMAQDLVQGLVMDRDPAATKTKPQHYGTSLSAGLYFDFLRINDKYSNFDRNWENDSPLPPLSELRELGEETIEYQIKTGYSDIYNIPQYLKYRAHEMTQ